MKTRYALLTLALLAIAAASYFIITPSTTPLPAKAYPAPTDGRTEVFTDADEGEDNQSKREAWLEMMHKAAPGVDWRTIEYQTRFERHRRRAAAGSSVSSRGGDEIIADGYLTGTWKERGSSNQAGSVIATAYDAEEDQIYLISDGGTFWKGARDGSGWEVINQDLQFDEGFLAQVQTDEGRRWLAVTAGRPHYSDDEGVTWNQSGGIFLANSTGGSSQGLVLDDENQTVFMLARPTGQGNIRVYRSDNQGKNYIAVQTMEGGNFNDYKLCNPHGTNDVYLVEKVSGTSTRFYIYLESTGRMELIINNGGFGFKSARANLAAIQVDENTRRFIAYDFEYDRANEVDSVYVYASENEGIDWERIGRLEKNPWRVGIYISPSNPDFMLMGEVEPYRSVDGGVTWNKINGWWEYYGDVEFKLHADMMYFNEFKDRQGDPFLLISNHGGLSVTYDEARNNQNIAMSGLNVGQFYDVRTDPTNSAYIYGGTQDQGFQRGFTSDNDEIMSMDQVISGDYGHIVFTENGTRLWTVYPWGTVNYYDFPQTEGRSATYRIDSNNESVWIPPMIADPDPTQNIIYVAGGSAEQDGNGSYLIRMQVQNGFDIEVENMPFDFRSETNGEVSALGISEVNTNNWYAATTNGRFFTSTDRGLSWEQSLDFVPTGQYLYGAAILPSKVDANTVYFGGSGYSNPAIYKTTDNGFSFTPMNEGLPPTLVIGLASNEDESLIFAATEAGPYVYIAEEERWFDMSGMNAPTQTYWSVEYLPELEIVRFGTYGRGIWDFQIGDLTSVKNTLVEEGKFKAFPNPSTGLVNVELQGEGLDDTRLQVLDINGRLLQELPWAVNPTGLTREQIDLSNYPAGNYIVRLTSNTETASLKLIKQ
ncbi:MAG: T9SS type A sorting domain-containing protein [Bacteroidota bacterium]